MAGQVMAAVCIKQERPKFPYRVDVEKNLIDLCELCWSSVPDERPNASKLVEAMHDICRRGEITGNQPSQRDADGSDGDKGHSLTLMAQLRTRS